MNAAYVVGYDLVAPGRDYAALHSALVALGATRVLEPQWVILMNGWTASNVREHLRQYMDDNDRNLVNRISQEWAGFNLFVDPDLYTAGV